MALTTFQRRVIRLIAANRKASGDSYVAGGTALNLLLSSPRRSRDIDLFHDAKEAVHTAFDLDSNTLRREGFEVEVQIDREGFVEAVVSSGPEACRLEWARDSAFRFFPLIEHEEMGLTLHPIDLATNKVLALVGRAEPRDWIDVQTCHRQLQPLAYLIWAASGKDPGLSPAFILEQASRTARYTEIEIAELEFEGVRPSARELSIEWVGILSQTRPVLEALPESEVGKCVLTATGMLATWPAEQLRTRLIAGEIRFHGGTLYGAYPSLT